MIVSQILGAGSSPMMAQTIGGLGAAGLVAVGNNQATALQLPASQNFIGVSAGGTGVKLPPHEVGSEIWIYNNSGVTVAIFPFELAGATFNGGSPVSSILTAKCMVFKGFPNLTWVSVLTA